VYGITISSPDVRCAAIYDARRRSPVQPVFAVREISNTLFVEEVERPMNQRGMVTGRRTGS
jgi:hypothetical protein